MDIAETATSAWFLIGSSHVAAALLTLLLAGYVLAEFREKRIARYFVLMVASFTIWIVGSLARLFTTDPDLYIAITVLKYVGTTTAPIWFLHFALLYDSRDEWVDRRLTAALLVIPAITLVVLATTQSHGLFYADISTAPIGGVTTLETDVGPWFWVFATQSWGLLVVGTVLFVYSGVRRSSFYRSQSIIILLGILITWSVNCAYVFRDWPHPAIDPTPIGFAVTSLLFVVGIFSTRLIDVVPQARFMVLDAIDDAVIVLDADRRVVDRNEAAKPVLEAEDALGRPAHEVVPDQIIDPATADDANAATAEDEYPDPSTTELTVDGRTRIYRHRTLPVGPDATHGEVLALTDITPQMESKQELERQNERLDEFASVLSHDLRNPLTVAQGNIALVRDDRDDDRLETAADALDRMETLTEDLLTLARHGQAVDDPIRVSLADVATRAWNAVDTSDATLDLDSDLGTVQADPNRLSQLLENVFRNAVEHGGHDVAIRIAPHDTGFLVEDDGEGLLTDDYDEIFDRGFTTAATGTGFGLSIVDRIVDAHDWTITAGPGQDGGLRLEITTTDV